MAVPVEGRRVDVVARAWIDSSDAVLVIDTVHPCG
jgi:hypothetical protein